jgi:hypothetical protein
VGKFAIDCVLEDVMVLCVVVAAVTGVVLGVVADVGVAMD